MPRWPLILFDLDGTLVDSFHDIAEGIRAACAVLEVPASEGLLDLARRGVPLEEFYETAVGAPAAGPAFQRFVDAYRAQYLPACTTTSAPYPGVAETLAALRRLSPRPWLAVATTKRSETAARLLAGTGLAGLIDDCCGCDGLLPKPDPAVLRRCAERARIDVARAVMVGDTDRDVLAARAAGCASVAVTYGGFSAAELAPFAPDHMIDSLADLLALVA